MEILLIVNIITALTLLANILLWVERRRLYNLKGNLGLDLKPLTLKELPRYIHMVAILLQLTNSQTKELLSLGCRIEQLWIKSGVKFTIQYLSEAFRMVGNFIAGRGVPNHKSWVSHYKNGLPKILGLELSHQIEKMKILINSNEQPRPFDRAIITVLSCFRTLSPKLWIPNFKTLTDPFIGESESFSKEDIVKALRSMGAFEFDFKLKSPIFFWSNKSGVNARYSYLSSGLDLVALMRSPRIWFGHVQFAYHFGFYWYLFVFITLSILFTPFLIAPIDLHLGRLGLIKELRGKTRIIGITDQWTQWLFRPLHDTIYSFLAALPEDGTNDQLKPVKEMLIKKTNQEFFSLDLSAATDRLPVKLQADILDALGLGGSYWKVILNRPYLYIDDNYHYVVGQPMGAYSSFAMLALTNHLIVHLAHLQVEGTPLLKDTGVYAVLGDDIVIAEHRLASQYFKLMNGILGVVINPIKGFEGFLIEFAKNWFHSSGVNLTPLGAKSLLRSIRSPLFITAVIADYNKKEFNSILKLELQVLIKILNKLFEKRDFNSWKWLFSILGPQGGFWRLSSSNLDVKSMEGLFKEFLSTIGVSFTSVTDYYYLVLVKNSWVTSRSLRDLCYSYFKLFRFILAPMIWTNRKMKALNLNNQYTAVLATATVGFISLPILFLAFLRAVRLGFLLWIISGVCFILGFPYVSNKVIDRVLNIRTTLKRWYHNFFLNWELVRSGYAQPSTIENRSRPKKPISRVLNSSLLFSRWMLGMKTNRPVQLLVDRVKTRSDDELPAVKTAEKCLSFLNQDYNLFNRKVKSDLKRLQKLKKSPKGGKRKSKVR